MTRSLLTVAAICFRDPDGRILTVRKRGTAHFMLPGGKLEPGETPEAAARREIHEEIGIELSPADLTFLGSWHAPAANEPDTDVVGTVFLADLPEVAGEPAAAAEIAELRWVRIVDGDASCGSPLAPLLRDRVVPALAAQVQAGVPL